MAQRSSASRGSPVAFGRGRFERAQRPAPGLHLRLPAADRVPGRHAAAQTRRERACTYLGNWRNQISGVVRTQPGDDAGARAAVTRSPRGSRHGPVRSSDPSVDRACARPCATVRTDRSMSSPRLRRSGCGLRRDARRTLLRCRGSGPPRRAPPSPPRGPRSRRRRRCPDRRRPASSVSSRSPARIASHQRVLLRQRECRKPHRARDVSAHCAVAASRCSAGAPSPPRSSTVGYTPKLHSAPLAIASSAGSAPKSQRADAAALPGPAFGLRESVRPIRVRPTQLARGRRSDCAARARRHRRPGRSCAATAAARTATIVSGATGVPALCRDEGGKARGERGSLARVPRRARNRSAASGIGTSGRRSSFGRPRRIAITFSRNHPGTSRSSRRWSQHGQQRQRQHERHAIVLGQRIEYVLQLERDCPSTSSRSGKSEGANARDRSCQQPLARQVEQMRVPGLSRSRHQRCESRAGRVTCGGIRSR